MINKDESLITVGSERTLRRELPFWCSRTGLSSSSHFPDDNRGDVDYSIARDKAETCWRGSISDLTILDDVLLFFTIFAAVTIWSSENGEAVWYY